MKRFFVTIALLFCVGVAQAIALTPVDRRCIDVAQFARSVRIAMIKGRTEEDVIDKVDRARKNVNMPDSEWTLMKAWVHTVFTKPELAPKTPDEVYDHAISTCGGSESL